MAKPQPNITLGIEEIYGIHTQSHEAIRNSVLWGNWISNTISIFSRRERGGRRIFFINHPGVENTQPLAPAPVKECGAPGLGGDRNRDRKSRENGFDYSPAAQRLSG
jgi:hypothetical protein